MSNRVVLSLMSLIPAAMLFVCGQIALFHALAALFAKGRPDRLVLLRRSMLVLACSAPVYYLLARFAVPLPRYVRWFAVEPMLAWNLFAAPLVLVIGSAVALAQRLRRRPAAEPPAAEPPAALAPLPEPRRIFLARAASSLLGAAAVAAGVGIAGAEQEPEVTRHDVHIAGLHPDLDGLTIVQLSDIHAGSLMTEARMARIAAAASLLEGDLVVYTGDLLDISRRAAAPFSRAFAGLHGKLGTFACLGNHDYYAGPAAGVRAAQDAGAVLLRNSGARIVRGRGSLYIGGVDDTYAVYRGGSVDPVRALRAAAPEEARVVLAHRPGLFQLCARAGADLVLSGHTHGGQFALSPAVSMARLIGPYTMGLYRREGPAATRAAQLYVHRGMGTVGGAALRIGSPPELALLTLRRS